MAEVTEYIDLFDFSAGIVSTVPGARAITIKDGAATADLTYRVGADATGRLVPLPKRTPGVTHAQAPCDTGAAFGQYFPAQLPHTYTLDAMVMSPAYDPFVTIARPTDPDTVYILLGFIYNFDSNCYYILGRRYHPYKPSRPFQDFVLSRSLPITALNNPSIPSGSMDRGRTSNVDAPTPSQYRVTTVGALGLDFLGTFDGSGIPSNVALATNFDTAMKVSGTIPAPGFYQYTSFMSPDLGVSPLSDNTIADIGAPANFALAVTHQGRVLLARSPVGVYGTSDVWKADYISYSQAGRYGIRDDDAIFGEESPYPIGCMVSLNSQELLIIKQQGGAVMVRGDIANPTVSRLPHVQPTLGLTHRGVSTPTGFYYGSKLGIHQWTGGEASKNVSPQLAGYFWKHTDLPYSGNSARFGQMGKYVMVPNSYMLDTESGGWWRLEDPTVNSGNVYSHYDQSVTGKLYAFPWRQSSGNAATSTIWDTYDPDGLANHWSWQSQPLIASRERLTTVREIEVVYQNLASDNTDIRVTVSGINDLGVVIAAPTEVISIGPATDHPIHVNRLVKGNFTARHIRVRVEAGNTAKSTPAPMLIGVRVGVRDGMRASRS